MNSKIKKGICPECKSDDIYNDSTDVIFNFTRYRKYEGLTMTLKLPVWCSFCVDCGYYEITTNSN